MPISSPSPLPRARFLAACAALGLFGACATASSDTDPADAPARAAVGAPDRFVAQHPVTAAVPPDTLPGSGCHNPLFDPVDATELRLVRSRGGRVGDYEVPAGRYGVGPGELLRLECNTGRVVGIAPRGGSG